MAQSPDINETFLREVDENLRRDRARDFLKRNGKWLIAALLLFLAVSGGIIWYRQHQQQRAGAQAEQLAQIYRDIGDNKLTSAPAQLDQLSKSGSEAIRASALFTRAALALQSNDQKLAIAKYGEVIADRDLPKSYRDAALIRQTALQFDSLNPAEVIARLEPLAKPGNPWFGSAGEMTALALVKQGKRDEAGRLFATIARNTSVPESIRGRSLQMASSLGVDAGQTFGLPAQ